MDHSPRFPSLFFGRTLVSVGGPFLIGTLLLVLYRGVFSVLFCLGSALFFLFLFFRKQRKEKEGCFLFFSLGISLALLVTGVHGFREEKANLLAEKTVSVSGLVTYVGDGEFDLSFVRVPDFVFPLKIRVFQEDLPQVGDRVEGNLTLFSALSPYAREDGVDLGGKGKWSRVGENAFYSSLAALRNRLSSLFPNSREGAFLRAVLLGDREGLSKEDSLAFQQTASAHLLAISGLHITLLVGIFQSLLRAFSIPRRIKDPVLLLMIFALYFLTGGSVSVFRAAVMCAFPLISHFFSRRFDSLTALIFAGSLLILWEPRSILSRSFLFSFGSVFAILAAAAPLTDHLALTFGKRKAGKGRCVSKAIGFVLGSFGVSGTVFLFHFPLQLLIYGEVLSAAPLFALILIPLFTPCILSGILYLFLRLLPFTFEFLESLCLFVPKLYLELVSSLAKGAPRISAFGPLNEFFALSILAVLIFLMVKRARLSCLLYLYAALTILCIAVPL